MKSLCEIWRVFVALTVVGLAATASARDIPEVVPLAGGGTEVRFDNSCVIVYGLDQRMLSVNQYCAASQVNAAIEAANRYFSGDLGPGATSVICESRDGRRAYCKANTAGGVQLVRRLSSAPCVSGRDWSFDQQGIWVDNGCRAVFEAGSTSTVPVTTVTCESRNNRRNSCQAATSGGVRLVRRLSSAACEQGRGWGFDEQGIWVDNGCRAVFEIGGAW